LGYADKIFRLPLTVLIVAVYTGLHPYLAEAAATRRFSDFRNLVDRTIRASLFVLLPLGLAVLLLGQPIVMLVYQRGAFTASATSATAAVLFYMGLQIPSLGLWFVYDRSFICLGRTSYLMVVALALISLKLVFSVLLVHLLGLPGLACATVIAFSSSAIVMHIALGRFLGESARGMPGADLIRLTAAALAASVIAALTWSLLVQEWAGIASPVAHIAVVVLVMTAVYVALAAALNQGFVRENWRGLRSFISGYSRKASGDPTSAAASRIQ
jgi:putative peptidoglycan lipid II flippase